MYRVLIVSMIRGTRPCQLSLRPALSRSCCPRTLKTFGSVGDGDKLWDRGIVRQKKNPLHPVQLLHPASGHCDHHESPPSSPACRHNTISCMIHGGCVRFTFSAAEREVQRHATVHRVFAQSRITVMPRHHWYGSPSSTTYSTQGGVYSR